MTAKRGTPRGRPRSYDMVKRAAATQGTRRRIAEAALALFKERDYDSITLTEIAGAAGVSHQTVLNHVESKAGVVQLAVALFSEQVKALEAPVVPGDVVSVVAVTVARYEELGDVNTRWAALESRLPELVRPARVMAQRSFQTWLARVLGEHLPREAEARERRRVLLGLHAALDVFTWKLFRRDLGLSREETERQMTDLTLGVLARHRAGSKGARAPRRGGDR